MKLYIHSPHCLLADWYPRIRRLPNLDFHPFQLCVHFGYGRQWPDYGDGDLRQKPPWTHVSLPGHASTQWYSPLYCHGAPNAYLLAGLFHINVSCLSHADVFCSHSVSLWICCPTGHGFWLLCGPVHHSIILPCLQALSLAKWVWLWWLKVWLWSPLASCSLSACTSARATSPARLTVRTWALPNWLAIALSLIACMGSLLLSSPQD